MLSTKQLIFILCCCLFFVVQTFSQKNGTEKNGTMDFECQAIDLEIKKFRNDNPNRKLKVVIDRDIEYKAKPNYGEGDYSWELGDATYNAQGEVTNFNSFWPLTPNPNQFEGITRIPIASHPTSNDDLGDSHGTIRLSHSTTNQTTYNPVNEKVEVFFNKDEIHPVSGDPNWFHYWSQAPPIQDLLTIPGIRLWDNSSHPCSFQNAQDVQLTLTYGAMPFVPGGATTYGSSNFNPNEFNNEDPFGAPCNLNLNPPRVYAVGYQADALEIVIGEGCGFRKFDPTNPSANPSTGNIEGIHVLYSTVAHEVEHTLITCQVWADGYDSSLDEPLPNKDYYRDNWETQTNNDNAGNPGYCPFTIGVNDSFNTNYVEANIGNCMLETAGTNYEETRCRIRATTLDLEPVNNFDWSFDPTNQFQGKQW